jgi:hypothetical protein
VPFRGPTPSPGIIDLSVALVSDQVHQEGHCTQNNSAGLASICIQQFPFVRVNRHRRARGHQHPFFLERGWRDKQPSAMEGPRTFRAGDSRPGGTSVLKRPVYLSCEEWVHLVVQSASKVSNNKGSAAAVGNPRSTSTAPRRAIIAKCIAALMWGGPLLSWNSPSVVGT